MTKGVSGATVIQSTGEKLFLLDGMALVYRAHFALATQPIRTADGRNTSAVYGFTTTLLDLMNRYAPTHLAVVFDTAAPTARHREYPEYKAQREEMPEELSLAIPEVKRLVRAFNLPCLERDGYEADDIIGTLARQAEAKGYLTVMVTPDKDFGQLVTEKTIIYRPSRMGDGAEILGVPEVLEKWGVERVEQVIDILGLWGDSSDNIPGVKGIGEKTAQKLIAQFGSVEGVLAGLGQLKGKQKETLEQSKESALLSKRLATIDTAVPIELDWAGLTIGPRNDEALKQLFQELEFNSLGKRLFGDDFKAGRGFGRSTTPAKLATGEESDDESEGEDESGEPGAGSLDDRHISALPTFAKLKTLSDVRVTYEVWSSTLSRLIEQLTAANVTEMGLAIDHEGDLMRGLAFVERAGKAIYLPLKSVKGEEWELLAKWLQEASFQWVGHDLKPGLRAWYCSVNRLAGKPVADPFAGLVGSRTKFYDTALVHALIYPDFRHGLEFVSESMLGYTPLTANAQPVQQDFFAVLGGGDEELTRGKRVMERADLTLQLKGVLEPRLKEAHQVELYARVEAPLMPVLARMEAEGVQLEPAALREVEVKLSEELARLEASIIAHAGYEFNLGSARQLGEVLFGKLALMQKAKKTKTGQYATDERTLMALAPLHPIIGEILDHREASKLLSTYVTTLPSTRGSDGRVRTTFHQLATSTGRLNSQDPNLQNIPIRTTQGREIRRAFVPRPGFELLSADYSQIELRILAALTKDAGLMEALTGGEDIHTATAAKVYGIAPKDVTKEQRSKAKMVNYGISYGMSAFGLAQRLAIPRAEAKVLIDTYFRQYPGIRKYMSNTVQQGRERGYVETILGRRRYLPDLRSSNATVRGAAERNAINMPIQGSSADLIKLAMVRIAEIARAEKWRSQLLLQVHDELVFDVHPEEKEHVREVVVERMRSAAPELKVPIVVDAGFGSNWLEAH